MSTRLLLRSRRCAVHKHHRILTQLHTNSLPPPLFSPNPKTHEITDEEWELRTGRAIYILRETLPSFFSTGLVARSEGQQQQRNGIRHREGGEDDVETIYSPRIRLMYTPPAALPAPFPRTLHVEGLPLYMASSVFIRHTLNALYAHPTVELRKLVVNTPSGNTKTKGSREKNLFVGLSVHGTARVSGGRGEWDVNSTYTFSPATGLIDTHTVDSIHPAPHQAVWDAMRAGLGKVLGLGSASGGVAGLAGEGQSGAGDGVACGEGGKDRKRQ